MTKQNRRMAVLRDSLYCSGRQKRDLKRLERAFMWRNVKVGLLVTGMACLVLWTLYLTIR